MPGDVNTNGTTFTIFAPPNPNVCPGCGRCRSCGQPYPQPVPMIPAPFYPVDPWQPTAPFWYVETTPTVVN